MKTSPGAPAVKSNLLVIFLILLFPLVFQAAEAEIPKRDMDLNDASIKRGEMLFKTTCQNCHSLKYSGYEAKITTEDARRVFGEAPPDLSLMAKARDDSGAGYIYNLLIGFNNTPEKNSVLPNITMPPPFDKADPDLTQKAKDVSAFLLYTADPTANQRKGLGRYVIGYMVLLTMLLYFINRKTWKRIPKKPS
jgi:ubiquinol-cytochrome c reductase cytochrome c1 subunit